MNVSANINDTGIFDTHKAFGAVNWAPQGHRWRRGFCQKRALRIHGFAVVNWM